MVARPRLLDLLNSSESRRLTVVCAPAGYGKSTLVAQWLAQSDQPVAWASLDAGDNNPHAFFTLVVAALSSIDHGLVAGTLGLLNEAGTLPTSAITGLLAAELSATTRHFALVLDDFHVIENPDIHESMSFLLRHLPPTMHLLITSRSDLSLPITRWLAPGEVVEVM